MYCSQCGLDDDLAALHNVDSSVTNNTMNPVKTNEKSKKNYYIRTK